MAENRNLSDVQRVLASYGLSENGSVWRVQGQPVIYHKALEQIAVRAKIRFKPPEVLRAERDEAVVLVIGEMPDAQGEIHTEWSIGEALVGVNYRVSGKQAAYVYAMAEKRARDRVILKLIGLGGAIHSDEEAESLKQRDAMEDAHARFIDETMGRMMTAEEPEQLGSWWNSDERKQHCREIAVPRKTMDILRRRVVARIEALKDTREGA